MQKIIRKWSPQEKIAILQEAAASSIYGVSKRHGIQRPLIYRWKHKRQDIERQAAQTNNLSTVAS